MSDSTPIIVLHDTLPSSDLAVQLSHTTSLIDYLDNLTIMLQKLHCSTYFSRKMRQTISQTPVVPAGQLHQQLTQRTLHGTVCVSPHAGGCESGSVVKGNSAIRAA